MYRFHKWLEGMTPSFWQNFYQNPDILNVFAFINQALAAETGAHKLLERYDILGLDEHNVGSTISWEPLILGDYADIKSEHYRHTYDIAPDIIFIDAIYEKAVNPKIKLQHIIDYRVTPGKISFEHPLPSTGKDEDGSLLYEYTISKARRASRRIITEIGALLKYERQDSVEYRDSIAPVLAALYDGPKVRNIVALANTMFGYPVAKYGNERVLYIKDGKVITDKYEYNTFARHVDVKVGDVLDIRTPILPAVDFFTDKTHPEWWKNVPAEMFQKYVLDKPMTNQIRDYMMSTFLRYSVAHMRINLGYERWENFYNNKDLEAIFYDALPTRTDLIISQALKSDFDVLPDLDRSTITFRNMIASVYGKTPVNSEQYIKAAETNFLFVTEPGDPHGFYIGKRYHIIPQDHPEDEFWTTDKDKTSYMEPVISRYFVRLTRDTPTLIKRAVYDMIYKENYERLMEQWGDETLVLAQIKTMVELYLMELEDPKHNTKYYKKVVSYGIIDPNKYKVKLALRSGTESGPLTSVIPADLKLDNPITTTIKGTHTFNQRTFDKWDIENMYMITEGLVVDLNKTGVAISPEIICGYIPKKVRCAWDVTLNGGECRIYYKDSVRDWTEIASSGSIVEGVTGTAYIKIEAETTAIDTPVIHSISVDIIV